jgi:hypothetical protein
MDLMERHHIKNLEGVFMREDTPLVDFKIVNYRLVYVHEYDRQKNKKSYPAEFLFDDAITYGDLDDYFKNHVVEDGAQDIHNYLLSLGLKTYDLDEIVKRLNGNNFINFFWVKFSNMGARTWKEVMTQRYPIYK